MPAKVQATDSEWETISEGARPQVSFNEIGDRLVGIFAGTQEITPDDGEDPWTQYLFDDVQFPENLRGENVAVNAGYDLRKQLDGLPPHEWWIDTTYVKDVPVKGWPSPMHSHKTLRKRV
jgi:hypothetical protein